MPEYYTLLQLRKRKRQLAVLKVQPCVNKILQNGIGSEMKFTNNDLIYIN